MTIEIKGTVKEMFGNVVVSDKFTKKEIVITIDEHTTYPQHVLIQANNDKISALDNISVGDVVTAKVNINGRMNTNQSTGEVKYYNSLTIYTIQKN
jgi:hypothetical protein